MPHLYPRLRAFRKSQTRQAPHLVHGNNQIGINIDSTAGTGNVGINTTSPTEKLEVVGNIRLNVTAADRTLMFGKGSANIGFFGRTSDSAVGMYDWANSREVWTYYPATNRFAIMSNNVGIGTTSPGVKLDVSGDIRTNAGITLGGVRRTTWPASDFYYAIKINDYPAGKSGGTETVNCLGGYSRIACSGGVIHTGANDNEDNEAFIVRPNSSNGCEIKWEDDPVGSKTVEVYAYCLKF